MSTVSVRPFRPGDAPAATALLYESSGGMYDRYAGNRKLAERAIARALAASGPPRAPTWCGSPRWTAGWWA